MKRAGYRLAVKSEWSKLRSLRSTWVSALLVLASFLALSALFSSLSRTSSQATIGTYVQTTQAGELLAQFIVGVLGILVATGEYSSGLIRSTLTSLPKRRTVLAAKATVVACFVCALGLVSGFSSFFVALAIGTPHGLSVSISTPGVLFAILATGLYLAALALIGLGVGFVLRSTPGAVSLFVVSLLVLPLICALLASVTSVAQTINYHLPSSLGQSLANSAGPPDPADPYSAKLISPEAALLWLAIYTAASSALGWLSLTRRDA